MLVSRLIQEPECPQWNLSGYGGFDPVGGNVGIFLTQNLFETFIGTSDFDDDLSPDAEIAGLKSTIFDSLSCCSNLITKEGFAYRPYFWG